MALKLLLDSLDTEEQLRRIRLELRVEMRGHLRDAFRTGWLLVLPESYYDRAMNSDDFDPHAEISGILWEIENNGLDGFYRNISLDRWFDHIIDAGAEAARDYWRYLHRSPA